MDDFPGLLARDFGFKPQGKAAPMAASRNSNFSTSSSSSFGLGSNPSDLKKSSSLNSNTIFDDHDRAGGTDGLLFNDVFGGPPKYSSASDSRGRSGQSPDAFDYDSIFKDQGSKSQNSKSNSMPVFDKPVYDDDIFEGLPGLKSSSTSAAAPQSAKFDDVFASISASSPKQRRAKDSSAFDDLLGNLGKKETESRVKAEKEAPSPLFDDLIPGFGRSSSASSNRPTSESARSHKPPSNSAKAASSVMEDPFVVLESTSAPTDSSPGVFPDPLDEIGKFSKSGTSGVNDTSSGGGVFDDLDPLDSLGKSVPPVSSEASKSGMDKSPSGTGSMSGTQTSSVKDSIDRSPVENSEGNSQKGTPVDNFQESHGTTFEMPSVSTDSHRSASRATSPPSYASASPNETNSQVNTTPRSEEIFGSSDDVWLTVSEIPLFTEPTSAPPPSRPPPPRPTRVSKPDTGHFSYSNARKKVNEFSSAPNYTQYSHSPKTAPAAARSTAASQLDELEDFAMGRSRKNVNGSAEVPSADDVESSIAAASAAAMKEAMDRAEAKFRHAKEMRERESLKAARSKESVQLDKDERTTQDYQERELRERHERQQREREEEEREQRRFERERERAREIEREREEKEREQRRLEREREREKARQAVERATREARERAAAEARLKAERAAVQRAQAEARERAAADARGRAEKAAAEARERASAEARQRAERAAVERAAAEARERASAEARERAAAAARVSQSQQKNDNDLESFFSSTSRPSSAPRPRASTSDSMFDTQSKGAPEVARRTSVGTSSNMKKASSTTNIVDDLTSIFGASSSGDFHEIDGETEERRKARLERHQRTQERAAKALAEKNNRDLQAQREQAERYRIAETLDVEIKRWAAGKEGNLRALLSTLQYVLWPECGWQPVSLTDLITGAAVKKQYRKATLCIHPDKVQQKGANLQQKYIAEKVFDLLKEAWNKFNSEELF